jgi:hypothetical protein
MKPLTIPPLHLLFPNGTLSPGEVRQLEELEARIARRADELAASRGQGSIDDRRYWHQAEREILRSMRVGPGD